jgi:hypothetical protein
MNTIIKIIKANNPEKAIASHAEAMHCLEIIKGNFSKTKNELYEIGLLGERVDINLAHEKDYSHV